MILIIQRYKNMLHLRGIIMSQYNFVETDQVAAPVQKLKTNRSFVKFILLSIVTLGIYGLVEVMSIGIDLNTIVGRRDGKKTINYLYFIR